MPLAYQVELTYTGLKAVSLFKLRKWYCCVSKGNFYFHDLRHSFASNLIKKGVSIFIVKELPGHQDAKLTQIYSHLTIDGLQIAVNQLGVNL